MGHLTEKIKPILLEQNMSDVKTTDTNYPLKLPGQFPPPPFSPLSVSFPTTFIHYTVRCLNSFFQMCIFWNAINAFPFYRIAAQK